MNELESTQKELTSLKIEHARLQGDYIGFLYGLSWWTLPDELVAKIKEKRKELIEKIDDETRYFVEL